MNNAEGVGKLSDVCCHLTDSYLLPQRQHQQQNIIQVGQGPVAEAAAVLETGSPSVHWLYSAHHHQLPVLLGTKST